MHFIEVFAEGAFLNEKVALVATGAFVKQNAIESAIGWHNYGTILKGNMAFFNCCSGSFCVTKVAVSPIFGKDRPGHLWYKSTIC